MENAVNSLRVHCIDGITANAERTRDMVLNSLGIVTLLKPSLGYKQCAEIAREGYETASRCTRSSSRSASSSRRRDGTRCSRSRT